MIIQMLTVTLVLLSPQTSRRYDAPFSADAIDVYFAVLGFFDPPRNQVRWLDSRLLASAGDSTLSMPSAMRDSLLQRLGRRFEVRKTGQENDPRSGGLVRLSRIVHSSPDSVRVTAKYVHHMPYQNHMETDLSFLIVKRKGKWVLVRQSTRRSR